MLEVWCVAEENPLLEPKMKSQGLQNLYREKRMLHGVNDFTSWKFHNKAELDKTRNLMHNT